MQDNQNNQNKTMLDEIQKFKNNLEKRTDFSEDEKKRLFDIYADHFISLNIKPSRISINSEKNFSEQFTLKQSSFASLVSKAKISQHTDIVLFAIYYLVLGEKYESVNVKDIHKEYKNALLKTSTNTNVYLRNLVRAGLIMPNGKKEGLVAFTITQQGKDKVEEAIKNAN